MSNITYEPVQQALAHLKTFSADEEMRHRAFVRERALMDEISEKRAEREKGKYEQTVNIFMRLLTRRFGPLTDKMSDDIRQRINIATTEQLEHWTETILDAKTLKSVFDGH